MNKYLEDLQPYFEGMRSTLGEFATYINDKWKVETLTSSEPRKKRSRGEP